jgi:hypothetical protein
MACSVEEEKLLYVSFCESLEPALERTLEMMNVFTNMTTLLATTEARAIMFRPRKTLRMM